MIGGSYETDVAAEPDRQVDMFESGATMDGE